MRVIAPDVGGGFGSKLNIYAEEYAACPLAGAGGAPVKWIETRTREHARDIHGRDHIQYVELAVDEEGKILGLKVDASRTWAPTCSC